MHRSRVVSLRLFVLAFALVTPALAQEPGKWDIDPAHSSAHFAVRHLGISTVRGSFTGIQGTITIDDKNIANSSVQVTIDATTVNTQNDRRDTHLKSPDFFDVAKHPTMTFKSKKVEKAGEGRLRVTGDLTIHGTTREAVLDVEGPTPPLTAGRGAPKRGVTATTRLNRRDFGLVWGHLIEGIAVVGDEIQITIDLELNQQLAPS